MRYLGRFFYSAGGSQVAPVRIEVGKGLPFAPTTSALGLEPGGAANGVMTLRRAADLAAEGHVSGDSHLHLPRQEPAGDSTWFDLMAAEGVHAAASLAYNEPPSRMTAEWRRWRRPNDSVGASPRRGVVMIPTPSRARNTGA